MALVADGGGNGGGGWHDGDDGDDGRRWGRNIEAEQREVHKKSAGAE